MSARRDSKRLPRARTRARVFEIYVSPRISGYNYHFTSEERIFLERDGRIRAWSDNGIRPRKSTWEFGLSRLARLEGIETVEQYRAHFVYPAERGSRRLSVPKFCEPESFACGHATTAPSRIVLYLCPGTGRAKCRGAGRDQVDLRPACVINSPDFAGEAIAEARHRAYAT